MKYISYLRISTSIISRLLSSEIYCPDASLPRVASLHEAPINTQLPPYIIHIQTNETFATIATAIQVESQFSPEYIQELLEFGAVYIQTTKKPERYHPLTSKLKRIVPNTYIRVHVNPRRYPDVYKYNNYKEFILFDCPDYIVISKPTGSIPTSATVDNQKENILEIYTSLLKAKELFVVGRLDACTSGCLIMAKTSSMASKLNEQLRERSVRKVYRALCHGCCETPPPLGLIQHGFRRVNKQHASGKPSLLSGAPPVNHELPAPQHGTEWQLAELVILETKLINVMIEGGMKEFWECGIELLTGRTHQIRLQLSALGYPLVGDTRYIPVAGMVDEDHGDGADLFGQEPKTEIGLNCESLTFPAGALSAEGPVTFISQQPWWRSSTPPGNPFV